MSPTPCSNYQRGDGQLYVGGFVTKTDVECYVCEHPRDSHELERNCSNCGSLLQDRDFKVIMVDVIRDKLFFESTEDVFCDRRCLREFLDVWGF